MHGRVQPEGQSCRNLRRTVSQHMRSGLSLATTNSTVALQGDHHLALPSSITTTTTCDSFFKDGRQINVGDCALFKPPQDSPPFIGLIRWVVASKDKPTQLGVNWLYRPAEVKLGKTIPVEGAPNEIFYSFHKDEIPAASLLHPCKVAFLPKGVELPAGTSSFVCRRVYDIANKCLWWLTDEDYINERQEEVDQLLQKTKVEMHATLQPGGRSPKQVNGATSTSQLKPASDNVQSPGSLHSHVKGRKRERGDNGAEPVKKERSLRSDDGGFQCKADNSLKSEIARITEKGGGLTELEGVEKLVQLMHPDSAEKKMDLVSRSMLAGVMAATDKVDCLNRFVQLKGLPVLDEWLQDIHRGKIGDGNNLKDSDKAVEEFILVSLRALDRLPVDLQALQMCNIGKSVNHLRSHKNFEIQRKARSLVDTWKKRVEAEMISIDAKSKKRVEAEMISIDAKSASAQGVSVWPSKSRLPEVSHCGNRTPGASDAGMKSSVGVNAVSKTASTKSLHGENNIKSVTVSPSPSKMATSPSSTKDSQPRISEGALDTPLIKEDRSSNYNQSPNYPQSSGKEDGKSSTVVPVTVNKISGVSTRNRKNSGFSGMLVTGSQKEISPGKSAPALKGTAVEKLAQSSLSGEKVLEGPIPEGSSHKLIVKIPNPVHSPAQRSVGGSLEDSTPVCSGDSSPVVADKTEHSDNAPKEKSDACQGNVGSDMNKDSCQNDEPKDSLTEFTDGATLSAALLDEQQSLRTEDSRNSFDIPQSSQLKHGNVHNPSFSPMNALIESCAKYSEANASLPIEDDVGMKLLASVAAGEMSRSDLVLPSDAEHSTPAVHEVGLGDEAKSKSCLENNVAGVQIQFSGSDAATDDKKEVDLDDSRVEDKSNLSKSLSLEVSTDRKFIPSHSSEEALVREGGNCSSSVGVKEKSEPKLEINDKSGSTSMTLRVPKENVRDGESNEGILEEKGVSGGTCTKVVGNCKPEVVDVVMTEERDRDPLTVDESKPVAVDVALEQSSQSGQKKYANGRLDPGDSQQNFSSEVIKSESAERASCGKYMQSACTQSSMLEFANPVKVKVPNESHDMEVDKSSAGEIRGTSGMCYTTGELKKVHKEVNLQKKDIIEYTSIAERVHPCSMEQEVPWKNELNGSASTCAGIPSSATMASDTDSKVKFDLNEGFSTDDGKYVEPSVRAICSDATSVHMINSLGFSMNSISCGQTSNITVAAAAKGPFVPPEDLLRSKGELGWKGSAATSAFRPAEPRKALEMPLGPSNLLSADGSTSKHGRVLLDIDLNVPDERILEEMASQNSINAASDSLSARGSGGLDLDLNRVDDTCENGNCSTSCSHKGEGSAMHVKPFGGMAPGDTRRDFDLNDGPGVDDSVEPFSINQQVKSGIPPQLSPFGLRINGPGIGNLSSCFPPGNTYSTIAIPSVLPDRGENSFPVFPASAPHRTFNPSGVSAFAPDIYRGSMLSSPAVPFPSSPFQLPVLPFGSTFPLPSGNFPVGVSSYADSSSGPRLFAPPVHSQLLGPVGSVAPQFQRPYMVNIQDTSNNGLENSRKWGKQGLDLNAGPAAMKSEVKEMFPLSSSQHSVASSQTLAEEQARMYTGAIIKRKEPEGGWENESFRFKQSSWQ